MSLTVVLAVFAILFAQAVLGIDCHEPDFDSGWFLFESQKGAESFTEVFHGLPDYPGHVVVYVKIIDGLNAGLIFEAAGAAQHSDDTEATYGGVIFGYDSSRVRLWAPSVKNGFPSGYIMNVGHQGWGDYLAPHLASQALVKVLAWRDNYQSANYDSGWISFSSQNQDASFMSLSHGMGALPGRVKVLVKSTSKPNQAFIFHGMGSAMATDNYRTNYGGVVFAYSSSEVRLWAPTQNGTVLYNNIGHIINIYDGWGGEMYNQRADTALVRIIAWLEDTVTPDFAPPEFFMSSQAGPQTLAAQSHPLGVVPARTRVLTTAATGANAGFTFEGTGATQATSRDGPFGGLVFGYSDLEFGFWAPSADPGSIIFVGSGWGNGIMASSENTALVSVSAFTCYPPPDTDDCASSPCANGGACVDMKNHFTCLCEPGFDGLTCERSLSPTFLDSVTSNGPVAHWDFSSFPNPSLVGAPNSFSTVGAPASTIPFPQRTSPSNAALSFNGDGSFAQSSVGVSLATAFSLEVIFQTLTSDYVAHFPLITLSPTSAASPTFTVQVRPDHGINLLGSGGTAWGSAPYLVAPGATYHLVITKQTGRVVVYLNGALLAVTTSPLFTAASATPQLFFLGGPSFHGTIDELVVYSKALKSADVSARWGILKTFTQSFNQ